MPVYAVKRCCATPGCPELVNGGGHCAKHRRAKDVARGTRHERGYDNRWARYSKSRLAEHPLCVGYPKGYHGSLPVMAACTDHIVSIRERPDLRMEPSNHQSLCLDCNRRKGIETEGGFGR